MFCGKRTLSSLKFPSITHTQSHILKATDAHSRCLGSSLGMVVLGLWAAGGKFGLESLLVHCTLGSPRVRRSGEF